MATKEKKFIKRVIKPAIDRALGDMQYHEDKHCTGIPDISFALPHTLGIPARNGWIEAKYVDEWPKEGGVLKIPHFTAAQKNWLKKRGRIGGFCFLIVGVGDDTIVLNHEALDLVGTLAEKHYRDRGLIRNNEMLLLDRLRHG